MNKRCYKVIYNRSLVQMVAVSEISKNRTKEGGCCSSLPTISIFRIVLRPLLWRLLLTFGVSLSLLPLAHAYVIADEKAPKHHQPQVLLVGNQTPQIDIQTPSAAGVSLNEYRQFDIGHQGAILNNGRKNSLTQIAGWVPGNPNLIKGEAQVIVNQINSNNHSQLNGYIEVAGKRADVIIANPSGIVINGAGFINSGHTTLSTGVTDIRSGQLQGHDVRHGQLRIEGKGLDMRQSDYTSILAQQVKLDGPIYANDQTLDVIMGSNHIDIDGHVQSQTEGAKTAQYFALDSSHLGGMYAGSIRLISTAEGIGINHAGQTAAATLILDTDGTLHNSGRIQAEVMQLTAAQLQNSGSVSQLGGGDFAVHSHGLVNEGTIGKSDYHQAASNVTTSKDSPMTTAEGKLQIEGAIYNTGVIASRGDYRYIRKAT